MRHVGQPEDNVLLGPVSPVESLGVDAVQDLHTSQESHACAFSQPDFAHPGGLVCCTEAPPRGLKLYFEFATIAFECCVNEYVLFAYHVSLVSH